MASRNQPGDSAVTSLTALLETLLISADLSSISSVPRALHAGIDIVNPDDRGCSCCARLDCFDAHSSLVPGWIWLHMASFWRVDDVVSGFLPANVFNGSGLLWDCHDPLLRKARQITGGCDPSDPLLAGLSERVVDSSSIFVTVETTGAASALDRKLFGSLICIARPLFGGVKCYLIAGCSTQYAVCAAQK